VAILLAAIATIALSRTTLDAPNAWREYAALGESYFYAIIGVELTLVMLAAPAATAGAICVDRSRGTLAHMLMTELSDPEIVLGKLGARMLPILGLVACTWPVLAIGSLLGGIDPIALTLAFAIILAVALVGCTMAMALSVWARKPHEVVLVTYTFWMVVVFLWPAWSGISAGSWVGPPPPWGPATNLYYLAFAPYATPNQLGFWDYFGFFATALGLSAVLTILAIVRMRSVACRGIGDRRKEPMLSLVSRIARRLPGPSLDRNPVLWREWHRARPSRWLLALIALVGGTTGIACVVGAVLMWAQGMDNHRTSPGFLLGMFGLVLQLGFGLAMLSAAAPTSMAEERQRGSLDLLATTTLSTRAIVVGKWLGTFRLVPLLAMGPGLVIFAMATARKAHAPQLQPNPDGMTWIWGALLLIATILVHGALIASVGLAVAVWMKRQSRAIAASIAIAVLVAAAWPIFVGNIGIAAANEGMMSLSPVVAAIVLAETLSARFAPGTLRLSWWITFWDIECLALALGLLWLTVRAFDGRLGRIPDRPRRRSVLSDVVGLLAGLGAAGGLFGWIAIGIKGLNRINPGLEFGALGFALLTVVALLILAVKAPLSVAPAGPLRDLGPRSSASIRDGRWFAGRWWESFRPVPLLAIGPALFGLALATAHRTPGVVPKVTTLPDGTQQEIQTDPFSGITLVITRPRSGTDSVRDATAEEIAARPLQPVRSRTSLLTTTALAVVTILAHGAAVVSLGLAFGIGCRRRGRAIAASAGFVLFVTVAWPILQELRHAHASPFPYTRGMTLASPFIAIVDLLMDIPAQYDALIGETIEWTAVWAVAFILLAVVASAMTIRALRGRSRAGPPREDVSEEVRPAVESVLVGD
jgi:ABC-type transport system involved in multi-copper enzyme maturation permease subunit